MELGKGSPPNSEISVGAGFICASFTFTLVCSDGTVED